MAKLGGSTIEDINHWIQVYLPFVLMKSDGVTEWLHPVLLEALDLMRKLALHYLGYRISGQDPCADGNSYSQGQRDAARATSHRLASLIEEVCNLRYLSAQSLLFCTPSLYIL